MAIGRASRRWLRYVGRGLAAVGLAICFFLAAAAGVVLHADTTLGRRLAARLVTRLLSNTLKGDVEIASIDHLHLDQIAAPKAVLYDTEGRRVLVLYGLRLNADARTILRNYFYGARRLTVVIPHIRVERAEVTVIPDDETREPTIVEAFTPAGAPDEAVASSESERIVRVWMPLIEVGRAEGHVVIEDVPPFDARVAGVRGQLLVSPRGIAVDVARFGAIVRGIGKGEARGTATLKVRSPGPVQGTFEGFYGDIELQGFARIHRKRIKVSALVPGASPKAMQVVVPGWPLKEPISGRVELQGELPRVDVEARLKAGNAEIHAMGPIVLESPVHGELDVDGKRFDLRAIWPDAPATALELSTQARFEETDGGFTVDLDGQTEATVIAGEAVPRTDVRGRLSESGFEGHVTVHEPDLPIEADVSIPIEGPITIDARARRFSLSKLRRLPPIGSGTGSLNVRATIDGKALSARATGSVANYERDGLHVDRANISATARGSIEDLRGLDIRATATGTGAKTGTLSYDRFEATLTGRYPNARFDVALDSDEQRARASGRLALEPEARISNVAVSLDQAGVRAEGKVSQLDLETGTIDIDGFRITGAGGDLTGSVRIRPNLLEADISGENVDLEKLTLALGLPRGTASGRLRINAQVAAGRDVTRGRVRLGLGNASIGTVSGLSMQIAAELDDENVRGEASGLLAHIGTFGGSWDLDLAGFVLEPEAWRRATGKAELTVSDVELPLVGLLLGPDEPLRRIEGRGYARFLLERKDPDHLPNLFTTAATRGLGVAIRTEEGADPISIRGVDLHATGGVNGDTGDSTGTLLLVDRFGELATASGAIRIDLPRLVDEPNAAPTQIVETPLDILVRLPDRPIAELPEFVRPEDLSGDVAATLQVKGTLAKPTLFLSASGSRVALKGETSEPVDLRLNAEYDPTTGAVQARGAATLDGVLVAQSSLHGTYLGDDTLPWEGEARLDVTGLPFGLIGALADSKVVGRLQGHVELVRKRADSSLSADLRVVDASVSGVPLGTGRATLETRGERATASLRFDTASGHLDFEGNSALRWQGFGPSVNVADGFSGRISAKQYTAAVLAPLVGDVLERITGRIDAALRVDLKRARQADEQPHWVGGVTGTASLRNGSALLVPLGLELRDVELSATAQSRNGTTNIAVRSVRAKARSTKTNVLASANLVLEGPVLARGTASLEAVDMPLLLQGVSQGRATGRASAKLTREPSYLRAEIAVPELVVRLPRASSRAVIDLDDNETIRIVQFADEEIEDDDVLPWQLLVKLGDDVRIRRSDIDLGVTGAPVVELGNRTDVYGSVDLTPGGRVPILGKVFIIQNGTIYFDTGDPGNPRVDVTAEWRSPEGTLVYVDIAGTLNDAKVALRSDPPLPEPQVFAILLGGSSSPDTFAASDGTQSSGSGAAGAVGISSGVAALGLNELLGDSPVELRVGTTSESRPRYTAAVRIGENLWFEASTYETASTEIGGADRSVFSGTVDYRFTRNWSLRTELGTAGGALDLLWQYRY